MKANGIVKVGDKIANGINEDIMNYANRHQLQITIDVIDAKKFLGNIEDQFQNEAKMLVGKQIIKEPIKFGPPQPCSIMVGNEILYEYIELEIAEILDDDSYVITNRMQEKAPVNLNLIYNHNTKSIDVSFLRNDDTNSNIVKFGKLMKAAINNQNITIKSLKEGKVFLKGNLGNCSYRSNFSSIDDEIEFFECICDIEDYFNIRITVPDQIKKNDYDCIIYLGRIIKGKVIKTNFDQFKFKIVVSNILRKELESSNNEVCDFSLVAECNLSIWNYNFSFTLYRIFEKSYIKDFDKIKEIVKLVENGDEITITLISNTNCCYDQIAPQDLIEHKRHFLDNNIL